MSDTGVLPRIHFAMPTLWDIPLDDIYVDDTDILQLSIMSGGLNKRVL